MHDILFRIPLPFTDAVLPIHGYGMMAMIGFVLGLLLARWRARQVGISPDVVTDLAIWALFAGIAGSRVVYVIENSAYFFDTNRPGWSLGDLFKIWEGGLVFYGGLIGAGIVTVAIVWRKKLRMLRVLDVLAPSVVLGHAFGRIGCFLRGCCYGVPLEEGTWYGVRYPMDALAYDPHALHPVTPGTPMFPSQLLASLDKLIIFAILMAFYKRRKADGAVTALYFVLYSIHRFILEFFRGDTREPGMLSMAQWISVGIFFLGLGLFVYVRGSERLRLPAEGLPETKRAPQS